MSSGGKGSRSRPFSVSRAKYEDNWDKIFGKKTVETTARPKIEVQITEYPGDRRVFSIDTTNIPREVIQDHLNKLVQEYGNSK